MVSYNYKNITYKGRYHHQMSVGLMGELIVSNVTRELTYVENAPYLWWLGLRPKPLSTMGAQSAPRIPSSAVVSKG